MYADYKIKVFFIISARRSNNDETHGRVLRNAITSTRRDPRTTNERARPIFFNKNIIDGVYLKLLLLLLLLGAELKKL